MCPFVPLGMGRRYRLGCAESGGEEELALKLMYNSIVA